MPMNLLHSSRGIQYSGQPIHTLSHRSYAVGLSVPGTRNQVLGKTVNYKLVYIDHHSLPAFRGQCLSISKLGYWNFQVSKTDQLVLG